MAQNIFMASMYFFIPLKNKDGIVTSTSFTPIKYDNTFKHVKCTLEYAGIKTEISAIAQYNKDTGRELRLNLYLLHYTHKELASDRYFLAVGTSVDKVFNPGNTKRPELITAEDIVKIKWAFMSDNVYIDQKNVRQWIESMNYPTCSTDYFCHSVNDISVVKLHSPETKTITELQEDFENTFSFGKAEAYDEVFKDCDRFAYGLLKGDSYYEVFAGKKIMAFIEGSYYSKIFERIYANSMGTVFVRTHSPYKDSKEKAQCVMSHTIYDVFNVMENSSLFNAQQLLANFEEESKQSNLSFINNQIQMIERIMNDDAFQQEETDSKVRTLRDSMGITDAAEHLKSLLQERKQEVERKEKYKKDKIKTIEFLVSIAVPLGIAIIANDTFWGIFWLLIAFIFLLIYVYQIFIRCLSFSRT